MVDSLRYLSSRKAATALDLTKGDLSRLPLEVHDDLRRHLNKVKQIELWDGEYKLWWSNGQLREQGWLVQQGWYNNTIHSCFPVERLHSNTTKYGLDVGMRNGKHTTWYDNKQLWEHCWYKDGTIFRCQVA